MFFAFSFLIHLGHPALIVLVALTQIMMYREVVRLAYTSLTVDKKFIPLFRTQNYYWLFTTLFFSYGRIARTLLGFEIPYHLFLSFSLLVAGFVGFVFSLRPGLYRLQFSMFAWMTLALAFVVLQSTLLVYNMFQGLFWFVLPAILIICNDTWAYMWGLAFGRTPLIALSPKKTVEGFVGAFFSTCLMAFGVARVMCWYPILTCPQRELTFTHPSCALDPVFVPRPYHLPFAVFGADVWNIAPVQWHALVMGPSRNPSELLPRLAAQLRYSLWLGSLLSVLSLSLFPHPLQPCLPR